MKVLVATTSKQEVNILADYPFRGQNSMGVQTYIPQLNPRDWDYKCMNADFKDIFQRRKNGLPFTKKLDNLSFTQLFFIPDNGDGYFIVKSKY